MTEPTDDLRQAIALFRYGVIADLVHLPVGTQGTGALLRAKAERTYVIPGSRRTRVAAETMRHWIKHPCFGARVLRTSGMMFAVVVHMRSDVPNSWRFCSVTGRTCQP